MALKNVVFLLFVLACVIAYATAARTNGLNDAIPAGLGGNVGQVTPECLAKIANVNQSCSNALPQFPTPGQAIKFSASCCSALLSVTSACWPSSFPPLGSTQQQALLQAVCTPPS